MTTQVKQVLEKAVALSPGERAELVEEILASLDSPARAEWDAAWGREVEERIDAHERGEIGARAAAAVFEKIHKKYGA